MRSLLDILPHSIGQELRLLKEAEWAQIEEIRIRTDRPIELMQGGKNHVSFLITPPGKMRLSY
ncbi:hypothetical protein BsIDN1_42720 [Bacillus safensis]|uniref:Uncharacterized protein n=1 Tax=Bacillus safensis TaxID=561879 RepID=A0A5S9MEU0_BACIA|nr:hypothetical protein BsIDN1_42720 [Bacillus safensis]